MEEKVMTDSFISAVLSRKLKEPVLKTETMYRNT